MRSLTDSLPIQRASNPCRECLTASEHTATLPRSLQVTPAGPTGSSLEGEPGRPTRSFFKGKGPTLVPQSSVIFRNFSRPFPT